MKWFLRFSQSKKNTFDNNFRVRNSILMFEPSTLANLPRNFMSPKNAMGNYKVIMEIIRNSHILCSTEGTYF